MAKSDSKFSDSKREEISEKVAIGSIKYALLKAGTGHDVIFDFEKSISVDGNSGPYLQYTYARCQSVIKKSGCDISTIQPSSHLAISAEELALLRWIYRFPEVVMKAAKQYAPNLVCTFLYELAQRFNTFYNKHRIIPSDLSNLSPAEQGPALQDNHFNHSDHSNDVVSLRLLLTSSVSQVLKNGLTLLGIQAPNAM